LKTENPSLFGVTRVESGVDFVQRWEASTLLNGLISGQRAHSILLEVVRRLTQDKPQDLDLALNRCYEMQQFLNSMDQDPRTPVLTPEALDELFSRTRAMIQNVVPVLGRIQRANPQETAVPTRIFKQRGGGRPPDYHAR
jgi:hypothetical protein